MRLGETCFPVVKALFCLTSLTSSRDLVIMLILQVGQASLLFGEHIKRHFPENSASKLFGGIGCECVNLCADICALLH